MFCTISIIGVRSGCLCDTEQAAGCLHSARNEREQDRRDERGAGDSTKDDGGVSWHACHRSLTRQADGPTPCATPGRTYGRTDERTRGVVCSLPLNGRERAPERHHTLALICHMALCSWLSLGINVIISGMHPYPLWLSALSVRRTADYHFSRSLSSCPWCVSFLFPLISCSGSQ